MIDAIFVHLRRIVHTWLRRPDFWFMTFIAPLVYLFIVNRMFGSLVLSLIQISEPTRRLRGSRMPSSA